MSCGGEYPQRIGAALTYARRYALFTLVGIAGEDDLDAPDLSGVQTNGHAPESPSNREPTRSNGLAPSPRAPSARRPAGMPRISEPILGLAASAGCRDRLLDNMGGVTTADDLAAWAHRGLPTKNTLRTEDAAIVERAFAAKLEQLSGGIEAVDASAPDGEPACAGSLRQAVRVSAGASGGRGRVRCDGCGAATSETVKQAPPTSLASSLPRIARLARRAHSRAIPSTLSRSTPRTTGACSSPAGERAANAISTSR